MGNTILCRSYLHGLRQVKMHEDIRRQILCRIFTLLTLFQCCVKMRFTYLKNSCQFLTPTYVHIFALKLFIFHSLFSQSQTISKKNVKRESANITLTETEFFFKELWRETSREARMASGHRTFQRGVREGTATVPVD